MPAIIYLSLPPAADATIATNPLMQAGAERSSRAEAHAFDDIIGRVLASGGSQTAGLASAPRPTD